MRASTLAVGAIVGFAAVGGGGTAATVTVTRHAAAPPPHRDAPVTSSSETAYLTAVLRDLGAPVTSVNLTSLAAWVQRETSWPPAAAFNPLDTTLYEAGATKFNDITLSNGQVIHVWNYPTAAEGAAATAATIAGGNFPHIAAALTAGTGLCGLTVAYQEFLDWSGNGYNTPAC
jgi:hypothetical protein